MYFIFVEFAFNNDLLFFFHPAGQLHSVFSQLDDLVVDILGVFGEGKDVPVVDEVVAEAVVGCVLPTLVDPDGMIELG